MVVTVAVLQKSNVNFLIFTIKYTFFDIVLLLKLPKSKIELLMNYNSITLKQLHFFKILAEVTVTRRFGNSKQ